jgi:acetyl esterase/lipase
MTVLDVLPAPLADGARMYHAIEYASIDGFRPLQLDLYLPAPSVKPSPVIVYFHGGGWAVGTRRRFGRAFKGWSPTPLARLAAAGFAVLTVDYRLTGEAIFPAQLDDAKAAIRWVRTNASEFGIDPRRVVAWGESAGGHLALLAGLTGRAEPGDDVCAVIAWYAPTSLSADAEPDSPEAALIGPDSEPADSRGSSEVGRPPAASDRAARAQAASPISHVHAGAPPVQIHHGTADTLVGIHQSIDMVAALKAAGVPVEFIAVEGSEHFWTGAPDLAAIFNASVDFARRMTASA